MSYGVLIGRVIDAQMDRNSNNHNPHYHVTVETDNNKQYKIQINVRSKDRNSPDLLYYADEHFNGQSITILPTLKSDFHQIDYHNNINPDIAIDYIRGNLFDPHKMKVVGFNEPGEDNDLNEFIDHYMQQAKRLNREATIYVYGTTFPGGMDNIHMMQGNSRIQVNENGTWHDGGFLLHFQNENKWIAYFLAFQSQSWCTDDEGRPQPNSIDENGYPINGCQYNNVRFNT
ncbi:hypothetical protein COD79_30200 [Bacillus cereus]|uniref:YukJ family protein n=1 Tax=Bacillus cereus TaxID=1396 RepID=UPI000BEE7A54|nr:YukJ family protein [Bacillus cereus]PED01628.1 hypothetical protein CON14_17355 [Bacillus cereus]PEQ73797.1 hypothetical protein CN482_30620 [Bacillus cereus]PEU08265.1 hypothetical protein CN531_21050 [Bacillus cereus]PEX30674.1 hypothetical protein CN459_19575 [Bacillus cereus]PEY11672.1 hypothetical protein CN342_29330 [Bacillus cereus]